MQNPRKLRRETVSEMLIKASILTGNRKPSNEMAFLIDAFFERFEGKTEAYFVQAVKLCLDQSDFFPTLHRVVVNYEAIVASLPPPVASTLPLIEHREQPASKAQVAAILKNFREKSARAFREEKLTEPRRAARIRQLQRQAREIAQVTQTAKAEA